MAACFIVGWQPFHQQSCRLAVFLSKYVDFVKPSFKEMRRHIRPKLVLFISVIAITLYHRMNKVMLGVLSNSVQNGYYESIERIINAPMGIITALGTAMLP